MTPQSTTILNHLKQAGHIIFEIKQAGYDVVTTMKRDLTGQRYASYSLKG